MRKSQESTMKLRRAILFQLAFWAPFVAATAGMRPIEPIPDRLVVLTFDDSVRSQADFVAPLLKNLGFGATFFITGGFNFASDKTHYMTWDQIRTLHEMGFEIGNHTRAHKGVNDQSEREFLADLEWIERRCEENGIPSPTSFAYPGNALSRETVRVLERKGYKFARRGGAPEFPYERGDGLAYDPAQDHRLLIPSAGDARPDWALENFIRAVDQAKGGRIAVLQFHGVPDLEHPWVNTSPALFEKCMNYLRENHFTVVALRDLARYVDPDLRTADPFAAIERRTGKKFEDRK
jgi:peptidoglycan/xylan/chitin deacetylase (PgdA/CDA1 family)